MLLNFKDGTTLERSVGSNVVGIRVNSQRPISITLTRSDLLMLEKYGTHTYLLAIANCLGQAE